jgi:hypothetical protein
MGQPFTEEDYEHMTRQIDLWISEANRMWAGAQNSIQRLKQVQDKLVQQSQETTCAYRTAPWVEE